MQRSARVLRGGGSLALVMATIVACGGDPNMPDSATGDGGGGRVETGLPDARRDAIVIDEFVPPPDVIEPDVVVPDSAPPLDGDEADEFVPDTFVSPDLPAADASDTPDVSAPDVIDDVEAGALDGGFDDAPIVTEGGPQPDGAADDANDASDASDASDANDDTSDASDASDAAPDAPVCTGGLVACAAGACVDLTSDPANCGMCGAVCPMGTACVMGACACPAGSALCGGACVSLATSTSHCGACGNACAAGQVCSGGVCQIDCPGTGTVCGTGAAMACVNTQADANNCGACGNVCPAGQLCSAGACMRLCMPPELRCGTGAATTCVDPRTDDQNCGSCGTRCTAGANATVSFCVSGSCRAVCLPNFGNCDGSQANGCEANLQTDAQNCGACGNQCSAPATCQAGRCLGPPASVTATAGGGQSTLVSTPFATRLAVVVRDAFGTAVPGASVVFSAPVVTGNAPTGTFAPMSATATVTTDASGAATAPVLTASANPGAWTASARVGAITPATFALTNTPPPVATLTPEVNTTPQDMVINMSPAVPLGVVARNSLGALVVGTPITFVAPSGGTAGGYFGTPGTSTVVVLTDAMGVARPPAYHANGVASMSASYNVVASSGAVTAMFSLRNLAQAVTTFDVGPMNPSICPHWGGSPFYSYQYITGTLAFADSTPADGALVRLELLVPGTNGTSAYFFSNGGTVVYVRADAMGEFIERVDPNELPDDGTLDTSSGGYIPLRATLVSDPSRTVDLSVRLTYACHS